MVKIDSDGKKSPDSDLGHMSRLEKLYGGVSGPTAKGVKGDSRSALQKILKGTEGAEGDLPEGWEDYLQHAEAALRGYAAEQEDQQEVWKKYQTLLTTARDEEAGSAERIEAMVKILVELKQTRDSRVAGRDRDLKERLSRAVQKAPAKVAEMLTQESERKQQKKQLRQAA